MKSSSSSDPGAVYLFKMSFFLSVVRPAAFVTMSPFSLEYYTQIGRRQLRESLLTEKDGRRRTGQTRQRERDVSTNQKRFIKVSLGESRRILMSEKAKGANAGAAARYRLFGFLAKL